VRAQERVVRSGENVHSDVLRSMARLANTYSEPRPRRSVLRQPVNEQRIMRRRPSTVHTPEFRNMITRMNLESAEAVRVRTAERVQSLVSSGSSDPGEESLSDLIDAVDLGREDERDDTGFTMLGAASNQEHLTYDDHARNQIGGEDESSVADSSAIQ
jgi:hypothetical protein